ncbi:tRNA (guanosine(46)-N7)-methyltransferase TrmB [Spirosoma sp. KCTC 42546]|uniref:tRNA (guanosine(46)-N7)-methyltransferase TrmB n=1 Tax=Spirosoma sp. KCTC 42546 TaxID=2520506 RepID=UPI0011592DBB|nr:tRNA (guanosine(46)-N7)-methyltransferase TrmB [Spirosoma sp. KCTC 42546]QDK80192.1 tRNA (guanosine(46)-N7)-methyltransferase TrmB [Spirosoma sp. KCTC 42546]
MTRRKTHRFLQNAESQNVIEVGKPLYKTIRGHWRSDYFGNENPIVLELACGKGEYTVGLAQAFPDKNFIGVDIKGDRIARGSQAAQTLGLANVAFLRTDINFLHEFFSGQEVNEIWITFPDPQPRPRQEKHRLTHPRFLSIYKDLFVPGGTLHLKTDNPELFAYSLEQVQEMGCVDLQSTTDLYNSPLNGIHIGIKTKYEQLFFDKGFTINYLQCKMGVI